MWFSALVLWNRVKRGCWRHGRSLFAAREAALAWIAAAREGLFRAPAWWCPFRSPPPLLLSPPAEPRSRRDARPSSSGFSTAFHALCLLIAAIFVEPKARTVLMGPSRGSRTINKIIVKGSEYQQQHDDQSSSSKAKQKVRIFISLGSCTEIYDRWAVDSDQ